MKILNLGFGILLLAGLAFAADDLDSAFQGLQAAEKSGDTAQIKTLAVETCNFAKPIINSPAPETADAKEEWKQRVEYAQSAPSPCGIRTLRGRSQGASRRRTGTDSNARTSCAEEQIPRRSSGSSCCRPVMPLPTGNWIKL